jgi:hypothetical protein
MEGSKDPEALETSLKIECNPFSKLARKRRLGQDGIALDSANNLAAFLSPNRFNRAKIFPQFARFSEDGFKNTVYCQ